MPARRRRSRSPSRSPSRPRSPSSYRSEKRARRYEATGALGNRYYGEATGVLGKRKKGGPLESNARKRPRAGSPHRRNADANFTSVNGADEDRLIALERELDECKRTVDELQAALELRHQFEESAYDYFS